MQHLGAIFLCTVLAAAGTVDSRNAKRYVNGDDQVLQDLLLQSGGPAGSVPVEIKPPDNPLAPDSWDPYSDAPCSEWAYEYTKMLPERRVRHEHAVVRNANTTAEALDVRGIYLQFDPVGQTSFSLEYSQNGEDQIGHYIRLCSVEPWNVMKCNLCGSLKDYIIYEDQNPSCREAGFPPPTVVGNTTMEAIVGVEDFERSKDSKKFHVSPLLELYGGLPGQLRNLTKNPNIVPPPEPIGDIATQRPLPDAPQSSWVYEYRGMHLPTSIRFEHAVQRFQGTPKEFLDIRGVLYWRSNVGDFRVEYRSDDTGLHAALVSATCMITRGLWRCDYSEDVGYICAAGGVSAGLLASLVG